MTEASTVRGRGGAWIAVTAERTRNQALPFGAMPRAQDVPTVELDEGAE
jgi:hypothetical protein